MAHVEHQEGEASAAEALSEGQQDEPSRDSTPAAAASLAQQRRKIAQLEEKLEVLEAGRASKERYRRLFHG